MPEVSASVDTLLSVIISLKTDARIVYLPTKQVGVDGRIVRLLTKAFNVDSLLQAKAQTLKVAVDALLAGTLTKSCQFDTFLLDLRPIRVYLQPPIRLDGRLFYFEAGSREKTKAKNVSLDYSLTCKARRQFGKPPPQEWRFSILCFSQEELFALSGLYQRVKSERRKFYFEDITEEVFEVYFTELGDIEPIDRKATKFSVPITLRALR